MLLKFFFSLYIIFIFSGNTEWAKQNFYLSSRQKGVIMTKKVLDREKQEYYLVCVEAKPASRRKRSVYDEDRMDRKDVVAYIIVRLLDANDNRPEFPNKAILLGKEGRKCFI